MKYILLCALLLLIDDIICAQTINNGLYVNNERNEFVIVKNDTIQFRYFNDDGLASFTIGEGVLESVLEKKGKRKIIIRPSLCLIEKTSVIYRYPRSDNMLSIRVFYNDSLAIAGMNIIISRSQDKKPHVFAATDIYGQLFLNKEQIDYFDKKDALIYAALIGYTEAKKKIFMEAGYDYIIRLRMPARLSGFVTKGNNIIRQLSDDEIIIEKIYSDRKSKKLKKIGYLSDTIITFKKITDDYPLFDFPFDKDVQTLMN